MKLITDKEVSRSLLMTGLFLFLTINFSCSKEDPAEVIRQDFISYITGTWQVDSYHYSNLNSPDTTSIDIFKITSGSYGYQYIVPINKDSSYIDSKEYNISDGNFCKLSKVDKLQYWSINLDGDALMLYASSQCGGYNETFEIIYTNLWHNVLAYEGSINADIILVNQHSEIVLNNFVVYNGHVYEGTSFSFSIDGDVFEHFHFVKK